MAEGNQNMIRVWGGGIYEADAFTTPAMSWGSWSGKTSCSLVPRYRLGRRILSQSRIEARQNVRRLRCHPSIVAWAGNNEDYQIVERYGLEYDVNNRDPQTWLRTNFPARYLYGEHLLPKVVAEEIWNSTYRPSSPFGNGLSTTLKVDQRVGDVHQWNVWHGDMIMYQKLPGVEWAVC